MEDSRQIEVYQTSAHAALEALISTSTNVLLIETAEETKHIVESLSPRSLSVSTFKDFTQIGVNADQPTGKIQLKATHVERDTDDPSGKRRAHWVAGHYMKHMARPEKVFRMPHIRGAGPVIPQTRRVELPEIADQLATKERLATTGEVE